METHERAALALADSEVAATTGQQLLLHAIQAGAQTVHLEPQEELARVRYRVDGLLQEAGQLTHGALATLVAHFKQQAKLLADEHRWSQEGHFTVTLNHHRYVIKLTTLPLTHGEKAVLSLFNTTQATHDFVSLGIWGDTRKQLHKALTASDGLIVLSGAHHSGVSTTLRSTLELLNHPSVSVASVEEPLERRVNGVHQVRINSRHGVDYTDGLQAALASDANIILLGELHGRRLTDQTLNAAAKGRLLVAGMHSSSLVRTLTELSQFSSEPFMLAHHLKAVLHQRLVRRLCDNCKIAAHPDVATLRHITSRGKITVATLQNFIKETSKHNEIAHMQLYQASPNGCSDCRHTGFKGQIGLFELLPVSAKVQKQLTAGADPLAILHQATKDGMVPTVVDGFVKALCGLTTLEEVIH